MSRNPFVTMNNSMFLDEIRQQCCTALDVIARPIDATHICSQHFCSIVNIPVHILTNRGKRHACSQYCQKRPHTAWRAAFKLSNLYFCKKSTAIHICTLNCVQTNPYTVDGLHMCRISGRIYGTEMIAPLVTQYAGKNKHMYIDPYKLLRSRDGLNLNKSGFYNQAINVVNLLLFSRHRMYAEKNKLAKMKVYARKKVMYYVKLSRQRRKLIVYTDLIRIYVYFMNLRHIYRGLLPNDEKRAYLEEKYAKRCIRLWQILCTHSNVVAKHRHHVKYFRVFVAGVLYLMKTGLPMNSVQIIPRDKHLENSLPEANQLDYYNVPKNSFTCVKNDIQLAIRTIIEAKKISPHVLVLK